jgi:FMN phosphatase YigB (HAD superfamily)
MTMKISVHAGELADLLDRAPAGLTTLSLDCFDTLLWRNVHAPRDVFAEIDLPGGGIEPRVWAEGAAHRLSRARRKTQEVSLAEIYQRLLTRGTPEEIAAAVEHEIALEIRHCFPFAPVVALMRAAKARGLRIVIVSDTYLSETQLRHLIGAAAGADVLAMIDRVFVSSEYGVPKSQGLFGPVLMALAEAPGAILHVGDNQVADQEGAARFMIHTAYLRQFDGDTVQRLRLEAAAGVMLDPRTRVTMPAFQPHRAAIALRQETEIAYVVGHDVMGPVMHTLAVWLKGEVDALSEKLGRKVRPLFLMRDGYLAWKIFDALYPEVGGKPIEISRYAAVRASLADRAALDDFVTDQVDILPLKAVARQIGLYANEAAPLLKEKPGFDNRKAFLAAMRSPDMIRKLTTRSRKYADRMMAHVRSLGVAPGDAVMLFDVGYKGTVQNIVTPILEAQMGLTVAGRYMFLREECVSGLDKRGLLDTYNYECRALHALGTCVAVVEQMSNIAQGSTIDYAENGEPIREESGSKSVQNALRDRVQQACLDFALNGYAGMHRRPQSDDMVARRQMAGAILSRLLFMPIESEIQLFEQFDHDVNLGTNVMIKLLDHDEAAEGLRRRGLAYVNETRRMYVPGELGRHGLPLNLSLYTSSRFGLDLRNSDFEVGGFKLPVIMVDATSQALMEFDARPTAEGFYRVNIPIGAGRYTAGIQLGALCEWIQISETSFHRLSNFDANWANKGTAAVTVMEGLRAVGPEMYEADPHGVVMVPAPRSKDSLVLTLIFRPLRWRADAQVQAVAA